MVSANPHKALKLINDYAVSEMAAEGITFGEVMIAKDNRQMVEWLRQGGGGLGCGNHFLITALCPTESCGHSVAAMEEGGAKLSQYHCCQVRFAL